MALQNVFGDLALDSTLQELVDQGAAGSLRLDYTGRVDSQPVYLGKAAAGAAVGDPVWIVTRFTYESANADARITAADVRVNLAWTARTTPTPPWT